MSDYQQLAARFGEVRTSWKRTAALSGLAIVVTESIGILTILLFLDWLYQPKPLVRVCMWGVALAAIAWLIIRHVAAPLSRKISDDQIALYIEEHRNDLDGMLITAAEYGQRSDIHGSQAALIDMVVRQASDRARKVAGQAVDFSRLRKYCVGAAAGIGVYIVLALLFPNAVGHHIGRILNPWHATEEDLPKHIPGAVPVEPVQFSLSKGDASLARGTSFDFEATLSRASGQPVVVNFRPKSQGDKGAWQQLPMTEIEKLNGFQGTLPDVSEDLEFFVSSGADRSETHRLTVFDPLVIQNLAATTHFPDYVKLPDRVESPSSGDVDALVGSTVTVRINTSTPLKEGLVKWGDGKTQPVTIDSKSPSSATFSFPVTADATYDFSLMDQNGQQATNASSLSIKAIIDQPPTIKVIAPQSPVLTNPIGEINFEVEADDDFGVAGVDLVYTRLDDKDQPQETRIPLTLSPGDTKASPNAVRSVYKLMLENVKPPFKPDDAVSYHLEAHDAKGQTVLSDLGFISVGYYESWGTYSPPHGPEAGVHVEGPDLMAILSLVWTLNSQKKNIAPLDFQNQAKEIGGKMVDENGEMYSFVNLEHQPQLARVADKIALHAQKAHDALAKADTDTALAELGIAATLYNGYGVLELNNIHTSAAGTETVIGAHAATPILTMLEQARLEALNKSKEDAQGQEQNQEDSEAATAASKKIDDSLKAQSNLLAQAHGAQAKAAPNGQNAPAGTGGKQAADLAKQQTDVANQTKAAADQAQAHGGQGAHAGAQPAGTTKLQSAGAKAADAAKTMADAAKAFQAGKIDEGIAKAEQAKKELENARGTLQDTGRDKLEEAISNVAGQVAALLDKQAALRGTSETSAKELDGGKTPDQRQYRDLQKQAYQQTQLHAENETLNDAVNKLSAWATQVGQDEAIRSLTEAQKTIKRGQPEVKMAGAIIDLNDAIPATAVEEQKKAEAALQKVLDDLHNGSDALAASREAQLRRAKRNADDAKKDLENLGVKMPETAKGEGKTGEQNKAGEQPGQQPGQQAKAGANGEQPKPGEQPGQQAKNGTTPGAQPKPGEQPGQQAKNGTTPGEQPKPGEQPGQQPGEQPGAQAQNNNKGGNEPGAHGDQPGQQTPNAGKANDQGKPGEPPGAQAQNGPGGQPMSGGGAPMYQQLSYTLQRLATNLDNRDLVAQQDVDMLKQMTMDKAELAKRLAVDPKLLRDASEIVSRIGDKLEAETQAKTEASKLFSSQREECPPAYRQFVNQYFEALSQLATPAGKSGKP